MPEFNLLGTEPKLVRDSSLRSANKEENRRIALEFGQAYFDGPREQGYGGYVYDGRWRAVAERAIKRYDLGPGSRVLDIGCAKGFFVQDLMDACPGLQAYGLDISSYAVTSCPDPVIGRLHQGDCRTLPFPDASFDSVFCINTIHNLTREGCGIALSEIMRVARDTTRCFVQVDAFTTESEKKIFEDWMLTAKTYLTPTEWQNLFGEAGYDGDWYWTILTAG